MAKFDEIYLDLCQKILDEGKSYQNVRRNTLRFQIPSYTFRHNFSDGFPILTLRKLEYKKAFVELLWFLKGGTNLDFLHEHDVHIWDDDAKVYSKKNPEIVPGDVGKNYSYQWRNFNGQVDQLANLINEMRRDIMGSRLIVSAWNPSELDETALPPCHHLFQVIGVPIGPNTFGFELHWAQRSTDVFLGLPFDVITYATLAKILEGLTGFKALAIQGDLKCVHFYNNQIQPTKDLIVRSGKYFGPPDFRLIWQNNLFSNPQESFENLAIENFLVKNYFSFPAIKVKMMAPNP